MEPAVKRPSRLRRGLTLAATILLVIIVVLMFSFASRVSGPLIGSDAAFSSLLSCLRDYSNPPWYVAHALGEIDGIFYTDSLDAFLSNYEKGYRTFEVDLVLLKDGSAFCAHDGAEWMYGLDKPFAETTADEMAGRLCLGKYAPLTGSQLLDLVYEYDDASFLLDAKRTTGGSNHEILRVLVSEAKGRYPSILARMIPHTFGPADQWGAAEIYPFKHYWVAVYSLGCDLDRKSSGGPDRIVIYTISSGGPAALRQSPDVADVFGVLWDLAGVSLLQRAGLGLFSPLSDVRLYFSVDIMGSDTTSADV